MSTFEFKVIETKGRERFSIEAELNKCGEEGFQLIQKIDTLLVLECEYEEEEKEEEE